MDCKQCEYFKQFHNFGIDICLKTKDKNGFCNTITRDGKIPEWCPLLRNNISQNNDTTQNVM